MRKLIGRLEKRIANISSSPSFKYELFPNEIAMYKHYENSSKERGRKFIILRVGNEYEITVGWYWRNFEN